MQHTKSWVLGIGAALVVSAFAVVGLGALPLGSAHLAPQWDAQNNTTSSNGTQYTVTFTETGLPAGTNWTVGVFLTEWYFEDGGAQFDTSNTSTITFALPNGSYHFHVFPANGNCSNPDRGNVTVNGSAPAPIAVHFGAPALYTVTFTESGLPAGTNWSVFLFGGQGRCGSGWDWGCGDQPGGAGGGASPDVAAVPADDHGRSFNRSNTSSISFEVPNGTYGYFVFPVGNFSLLGPGNGTINVSGASPPPVAVTFSALVTYPVTFVETGLPNGTNWTVDVFGHGEFGFPGHDGFDFGHHHMRFSETTASSTMTFDLTNGTYFYHVEEVDGYYANGSWHGRVVVQNGSPPVIPVSFVPMPEFNVTFNETGLPNGSDWEVSVFGAAAHHPGGPREHLSVTRASPGVVTFTLPTGHYHFHVAKLHGWQATGHLPRHHFLVTGGPAGITVHFLPTGYTTHHHGGGVAPAAAPSFGLAVLKAVAALRF